MMKEYFVKARGTFHFYDDERFHVRLPFKLTIKLKNLHNLSSEVPRKLIKRYNEIIEETNLYIFLDVEERINYEIDIIEATPKIKLGETEQLLNTHLPEEFKTSVAMQAGESIGLSTSTIKRYINRKDVYTSIKRGVYRKI